MRLCPSCGATVSDKFAHRYGCPSVSYTPNKPAIHDTPVANPYIVESTAETECGKNGPGYPNPDGGFDSME